MVHATHQHQRVVTIRIQKAMNRVIKWVKDTGFKVLTEKTKALAEKKLQTRPRMTICAKEEKIEQIRQHRISGLTFDSRMNWLEYINNTKARTKKEDTYNKMSGTYHMGSRPKKPVESTPNDSLW
jgi:hypothetical protein